MRMSRDRVRALARSERPFLIALGLGLLVRALIQVGFPPAFVFSDGPTYLYFSDHFYPSHYRPVGYSFLLRGLRVFTEGVDAIAMLQHLLGLVAAVVVYALLRRWSVSSWLATLAVLPLLFDSMQLVLEHSPLSDVVFELLLVLAVAVLAWRRTPRMRAVAAAGLLLGCATVVRVVGEPTVLSAAVFCLAVAGAWRTRLVRVVVLVACFAVPVVSYASWYHHVYGNWALAETSARALYMRTTNFVDCTRVSLPQYERALCPREPLGERRDPTDYGWHADEGILPPLVLPDGVSVNDAYHDFAMRAIRAQPMDYVRTVARDIALGFWPARIDAYEYDTAYKWSFRHYVAADPSERSIEYYAAYGGEQPRARQPLADIMGAYGTVVYLPGPVLLALLLVALAGLVVRRPAGAPGIRPLVFVFVSIGMGLVVAPDITAEFVWRYQLPAIVLVPPAAALAWVRLRSRSQPGTTPTPSTDWPNGGVTRRSMKRVQGTTTRS